MQQALAQDAFELFSTALIAEAGITIDDAAIAALFAQDLAHQGAQLMDVLAQGEVLERRHRCSGWEDQDATGRRAGRS